MIDAHHHLWRTDQRYAWLDAPELAPIRRDFTPDLLRPSLAAAGVTGTVLVEGGRCDVEEAAVLFGHAAATPEIAGVVAWADVAEPGLADLVARYRALEGGGALVGLRSQVQAEERDYLDRPEVRAGLASVAAEGLAFDLVVRVDQLPAAARAAQAVPQLRFVLDHLGKPRIRAGAEGFAQWRDAIRPLAAAPNVSAKLSGLVTEADWATWRADDLRPYVVEALERFGAGRLMFGSDWPVCLLAVSGYGEVAAALEAALPPVSKQERRALFAGTATEVYGLAR
ncbi:MAG TPA: amidohydrolase family protein [Asanoa sp.]